MSYTNINTDLGLLNKLTLPPGARLDGFGPNAGPSMWNPSAVQRHGLGRIFDADDGTNRKFKYMKNGGTEIASHRVVAAEAVNAAQKDSLQDADHTNAEGATTVDILTDTGNTISDGDMVNGWMFINQSTDGLLEAGDIYLINDNKWVTSDTTLRLWLADQGGLRNAIRATANVTIVKNLYHDVIVKPTTLTGPMLGVTLTIVPVNYYFWAQYHGPTCVIIDTGDTIIAGEPVGHIDGSGTAGSVGLVATFATDNMVGKVLCYAAGADFGLVDLTNL